MTRHPLIHLFVVIFISLPTLAVAATADTVIAQARVRTAAGWTEALALKDGVILATGTDAAMRALAAPGAAIVELGGRTVLPGFYDMHVHPMMANNGAEGRCRIAQGATAQELLAVVAGCVAKTPTGQWVTGAQWQAVSMGDTPITRQTLDAVSPDHPVMLFDISGHSLWVNSKALAVAGITKDTPNPEGGIIERDADGSPTGVLRETARDPILHAIPPATPEENVVALKTSLDQLLSKGVVGLTDAMVFRADLVAYDTLADRGELHQTVRACMAYSHAGKRVPGFAELLADRLTFARPKLLPDCVKVFMDGVPTESHTAAMLEPYHDHTPGAPERGLLLVDPAELNPAVARWDAQGLTTMFHAAGDAAVRAALDSIEHARTVNGAAGSRHQVAHSTFIAPADLPRAKRIGATIEYSPYLWYPSPINDDIIKAIGPERIARVWPLRDGFDAGALVVAGSDWAVVPDPDPWLAIETSITRRRPGGAGEAYGPREAIALDEALAMFTINAARQLGLADRRGSLEPGKFADFVVVDRDPFALPATELHTVQVDETWIDGQRVFRRGDSGR